ncbi:uncharacterized protein TNCV_1695341 [Trichonephila clavipes]|nr:uncharacterized protein TNCV_1695341 [Trichonephila clavipes]
MANAFWVSVRNNVSKRWNTTGNDVSKNQSSADSAIRLPNTSILNSNAADITEYISLMYQTTLYPPRCHQIPSECTRSTCSLNQWVRSLVGLFTSAGTGEYFPPLQFTCRNCGGGDRGRVAIYRPFGEVSLSLNRTVTCMVLKANDRRTSCPCHDEFRGPRSDYVRQVALATTTTTLY